jgi:hypothetical protein
LLLVAIEQLATIRQMYSARQAEQLATTIAGMIDRRCAAFLLMPTSQNALLRQHTHPVTEQTFDVEAYLSANPDVVRN